jgi:hypothetical protein
VPLYEDLVRRALRANKHSRTLHLDAQRTRELAALLREAHAGKRLLNAAPDVAGWRSAASGCTWKRSAAAKPGSRPP